MDDITTNDTVSENEINYEETHNTTFEKNTLASILSSSIHSFNPVAGGILGAALSLLTDDELTKAINHSTLENEFKNIIKEAQRHEEKTWNTLKREGNNSVLIYIYNGTSEKFSLTHCSWDTSGFRPEDLVIRPWEFMQFILRSEPPALSGGAKRRSSTPVRHAFIYSGEKQAFNFTTSVKLTTPYDPFAFDTKIIANREHNVRSIGKETLTVESYITRQQSARPYSYAIVINLGSVRDPVKSIIGLS